MRKMIEQRETVNDGELIARARAGDSAAFGDLVRRYRGLVFAVCFQQTGSFADSEELTQEVFLAAHRGLAALREPEKVAAWLQGIARNLSKMRRRRPGMEQVAVPEQEPAVGETSSAIRSLELQDLLHQALRGVSERSRDVLALHYLGGYSYREISALCRLPLRTGAEPVARGAGAVDRPATRQRGRTLPVCPNSAGVPEPASTRPSASWNAAARSRVPVYLA